MLKCELAMVAELQLLLACPGIGLVKCGSFELLQGICMGSEVVFQNKLN